MVNIDIIYFYYQIYLTTMKNNLCGSNLGETSMKRPFRQETMTTEGALPPRSSSGISPTRGYQNQKGIVLHNKNNKAKAEAWEKAKIERIIKR